MSNPSDRPGNPPMTLRPFGVPVQTIAGAGAAAEHSTPAPAPAPPPAIHASTNQLNSIGKPPSSAGPDLLSPLSDAERQVLESAVGRLQQSAAGPLEDEPAEPGRGFYRGSVMVLVLLGGLIGLFVFSQGLSILHEVETLPYPARSFGYLGLGLLGGAVLISAGWLVFVWTRMATAIRVNPAQAIIQQRAAMRQEAQRELREARVQLQRFVANLRLSDSRTKRLYVDRLGCEPDRFAALKAAAERLSQGAVSGEEAWIDEFRRQFLVHLDEFAGQRIRQAWLRTGYYTGISPRGNIDTLIVCVQSFRMTGELLRIYGVRPNRIQTIGLLLHAAANVLLAAQLDQAADVAADSAVDAAVDQASGIGQALARFIKPVAGSLADGTANALLMRRLGLSIMRSLRPLP